MRDGILKLFIASMLFVSMEGVADSVDEASFHQTHHEHAESDGEQWFPDSDGDDHESEACEHFCHGHVVGLVADIELPSISTSRYFAPATPAHNITYSTAPPTPPPNL